MARKQQQVIARLRSLTEDLRCLRSASQVSLLSHVRNKDFPLEERFQVWIDFCDKNDHERLGAGEVSPIGDWVEAAYDGTYGRGADYDWDFFLNRLEDHHSDLKVGIAPNQEFKTSKRVPTVDEFKEILIVINFGSMCYDW